MKFRGSAYLRTADLPSHGAHRPTFTPIPIISVPIFAASKPIFASPVPQRTGETTEDGIRSRSEHIGGGVFGPSGTENAEMWEKTWLGPSHSQTLRPKWGHS